MSYETPSFTDLLEKAVTEPGTIAAAYSQFWAYSFGNQLLAAGQCAECQIPLGPIATFPRWKELGRHVMKGQKALVLCQPVTGTRTEKNEAGQEETVSYTRFVYKPSWFVLAQTDGAELEPQPIPAWETARALSALDITEIPFDLPDGNCGGYAKHRTIAINPINPHPHSTRFHELAHILLGHTAEGAQADGPHTPRSLKECEAEAVALLCCAALKLPGLDDCRGYIQHWYGTGQPIPETSARKIMQTADAILKAGRPATTKEKE